MKTSILRINKKTFLMCFFVIATAIATTSCSDDSDSQIEVKDSGLKTFAANLNYDANATYGEVAYRNQVYFSFTAEDSLVATATYGTNSWTDFYLISDSAQYNITSKYVSNWDLVFTDYTALTTAMGVTIPYTVTGVLINASKDIQVASIDYTKSENSDSIASAFSNLKLSKVRDLSYSSDVDAIGYNWKAINMSTYLYSVNTNYFYIVKIDDATYYKMRFIGFYGSSTNERVATIQYQLMK